MELTELQEKWLQALESGEYQQTQSKLAEAPVTGYLSVDHEDDEYGEPIYGEPIAFCCMGVACQIAKREGIIDHYDPSEEWPPEAVADAFGWIETRNSHRGLLPIGTEGLADLNDTEKKSFPAIAAEVRANPEKYFVSSDDSQD